MFLCWLAHFYHSLNIQRSLMMIPFTSSTTVTDVGESVLKHSSIVSHLLSLHALTGCDTVPCFKNVGKPRALKVLRSGVTPPVLGEGQVDYEKATNFICKCYNITEEVSNMSEARYPAWRSKTKSKAKSVKLENLPATTETKCFLQNVNRAELRKCSF